MSGIFEGKPSESKTSAKELISKISKGSYTSTEGIAQSATGPWLMITNPIFGSWREKPDAQLWNDGE